MISNESKRKHHWLRCENQARMLFTDTMPQCEHEHHYHHQFNATIISLDGFNRFRKWQFKCMYFVCSYISITRMHWLLTLPKKNIFILFQIEMKNGCVRCGMHIQILLIYDYRDNKLNVFIWRSIASKLYRWAPVTTCHTNWSMAF